MSSTVGTPLSTSSFNSKRGLKMASNQSLNHLLNFSLPPRQTHTSVPRRSNRKPSGHLTYGVRSTERFVNAQYRFVMKPNGDYTVHFADPDIFFQWHDVLQVIISRTSAVTTAGSHTEELTTCPICLSPPTAPRMTRCGHVFCFPCILHYLNISDVEKWIRCPICFDSVNEKQLKSVKWYDGHQSVPMEGGGDMSGSGLPEYELDISALSSNPSRKLRMRLIQRPQITTLALPRSSTWPSELIPPHRAPFHFLPDVFSFSKFMLATPSYLIEDLTKDLDDLLTERRTLENMKDDLGIIFVDAAESKVRSQLEEAEAMDTELLGRAVDKARRDLADIQYRETKVQYSSLQNLEALRLREDAPEELLTLNPVRPSGNPRTPRPRRNVNPPPPSTSTYFYYQSAVGSPIFLHPLDIRILLAHFGSYAAFPNDITIVVEAFSEGAVNDDLRKRCKYLALPEGADVVFVEANLESVVGADGVKNFDLALKTRRAKRKEKGKKDDRAKMRAEEKERERVYGDASQWGGLSSRTPVQEWLTSAEAEPETSRATPSQQAQPAGAWGSRSFASALHASPPAQSPPRSRRRDEDLQDEWDVDVAWHEMEQRGGGRKKRNQKMVILGGGPAGARRR